MKNKVLLSILVLTSILNSENLKIGIYDEPKNKESEMEKHINRCLFSGLGYADKWNFQDCTKLVRFNDKLNVYCTDSTYPDNMSYDNIPNTQLPHSGDLTQDWVYRVYTRKEDDNNLDYSNHFREFNRVNWQYVNNSQKQLIEKCLTEKISLNKINEIVKKIYNKVYKDQVTYIACADKTVVAAALNFQERDTTKNNYAYSVPAKKTSGNNFKVKLAYNFSDKDTYATRYPDPIIEETFKEFTTNTTGKIIVKTKEVENNYKSNDNLIVYVTEHFTNIDWKFEEAGNYLIGNNYFLYGYGDESDKFIIYPIYSDGYLLKPIYTVFDQFTAEMRKMAGSKYEYNNENIKRYSEQLLLKNTRISSNQNKGYYTDKYYGGLNRCYNFDIVNFNSINQVKPLRVGYFIYGNNIVNGDDNDKNHFRTLNSNKEARFSIHKTYDNMTGVYPKKDGATIKYSINLRPAKTPNNGDRSAGQIKASLSVDFYPDIKSIELSKDTMSVNEFDDLTFKFKDINGNIITPYMPNGAEIYISQYRLNFPPSEYYNPIAYIPLIKNGNVFKINTSHENYQKLKADMLKKFKKGVTNTFTILEIKDRNADDYKDRPIYQAGLKNYEIIEGEQAQVTFDEDDFINDLRLIQASAKNNTTIIQPGSPIENIILNEKLNNPNGVILTRTDDDYIYFVIDNPSKQTNISFSMEENGKNLTKDDFETYEINNTNRIAKWKNHKANIIRRNGDKYSVAKIYNNKTLVRLNKHNASKNNSLKIKIYRSYDDNIKKLADNDNSDNPKDYETLLEERKVIGEFIQKTVLDEQVFSIRHKGIIYNPEDLSQKVSEIKDFKFTAKSCAINNNSLTCVRESPILNNNKLTYAGLLVKNEKSVSPENTKIYLYLDDGTNIFSNKNAKSNKPSATMELSSGKGVLKSSLPLVTKAQILLSETYIASDDAKRGQCVEFDETNPFNFEALNKIDSVTGKIYCQTPMCKNINGKIECDGKGFEYEFKSDGISLNLKDEKEPIKELKGLIPYIGAQQSSSSWDGAINITDRKPLEISLNIQDKDNYYINFAKDKNKNYSLVNLNLSFETKTDKLQQDDKNDYFKNYVMVSGSTDFEIIESSANKNADCGYIETITDKNVNVGKCINIKNDSAFTMLNELKKVNESTKLSDLLNDPTYKANDTYGELKVEVAYPKVDVNGNFKTQPPFKVTLQNGYVSNEVSNTNDKYELNKVSKSHLFTKTGLYFKDVSNNDGRLFYDKKDTTTPVNNGIKYINENNKIEDLKDCGSEPCYGDATKGITTTTLIGDPSKYSYDYQDSEIIVKGSDLTYKPHDDNKAEYIKDTIRYSTDKSSYLGSEKNSFTLEYKRN